MILRKVPPFFFLASVVRVHISFKSSSSSSISKHSVLLYIGHLTRRIDSCTFKPYVLLHSDLYEKHGSITSV